MNGPLKATKLGVRSNSRSAVRNQPSGSMVSASMLAINLPLAARHPALRACTSPLWASYTIMTPGIDDAICCVLSVLLLFTTIISASHRVRQISARMAARHDAMRASSCDARTTKLTSGSDIPDPHYLAIVRWIDPLVDAEQRWNFVVHLDFRCGGHSFAQRIERPSI